jgi:hypothetical protein
VRLSRAVRRPRSLWFTMRPDELEKQRHERLDALGPAPRALRPVLVGMLREADRSSPG